MTLWKTDDELFSIVRRELFTCVVGDAMDKLDLQHPESIADAFVFLCSPLAREINGQILSPNFGAGIGNRL